jgi:YD repeat-containing protein
MGFFRAAFARVFFGVSNTLSVIMRSVLHAVITTPFSVWNVLCQDVTPRFCLTPCVALGFVILSSPCVVMADYTLPAPETYQCARIDGAYGQTGYWLSQKETSDAWGRMVSAYWPALTHWWIWSTLPYVPISGFNPLGLYCEADNGIPYIPGVTTSPPYDDIGSVMDKGQTCTYRSAAGTTNIGSLGAYVAEDGTTKYTCTVPSRVNPKELGAGMALPNTCSKSRNLSGDMPDKTANPISASWGSKYQEETDFNAGSSSFTRYYNSISVPDKLTIGAKWRHNFDRQLSLIGGSTWIATASREDGQLIGFTKIGSNWIADGDVNTRLIRLTNSSGNPSGWQYTTAEDEVELYDVSGKLLTITNRAGLTQTLTYSDGTNGVNGGYMLDATGNPTTTLLPADLLIRVTDAFNRTLSFGYDASNRIVKMSDPTGGVYLYGYDTNNNLTSVTYPDGSIRQYSYNETGLNSGANLPHALTGITDKQNSADPGSRYASYSYDAQGRAFDENHAPNMSGGPVDHYNLAYTTDASGNPATTVVTDPRNTPRTYHFTTVLGVVKSTGTDQPGGFSCGRASSAMAYDANGNVASRADFNQHKTCYAYDLTRNLETARIEGLASTDDCATALAASTLSGVARKTTTVWDTTYRLPHLITEAVGKPEERVTTINYDPTSGNVLSKSIKETASGKTRTWVYSYTTAADNTLLNLLKTVNGPRTDVADVTTYTPTTLPTTPPRQSNTAVAIYGKSPTR